MKFFKDLFVKRKLSKYDKIAAEGIVHLQTLTKGHMMGWRLGKEKTWKFSQEKVTIEFIFSDGIVAFAPAQAIGSLSKLEGTWMWSWNNESVSPKLTRDARKAKEYGKKEKIKELTTPLFPCNEDNAWNLTAITVKLCKSQGAYRGDSGDSLFFFSFGKVLLKKN